MVAYTSSQTGPWDNVATWGGGGFPTSGDTAQIQNTHVVSVFGAELCGDVTIDVGGTLRFDGDTEGTPAAARLQLDDGATVANSGTIDAVNTSATYYAQILGVSLEPITGNQPTFGDDHWRFQQIDFQMAITTGGGGCSIVLDVLNKFLAFTLTVGDSLDGNTSTSQNGGNLDLSGTFIKGTSTFQFIASVDVTAPHVATGTFYNVTLDDNVIITLCCDSSNSNVLTIDGTNGGGITDGLGTDWRIISDNATPLVIGANGDLTGLTTFQFQMNVANYNIPENANYPALSVLNMNNQNIDTVGTLTGPITCSGDIFIFSQDANFRSTLDTSGSNHKITCRGIYVGSPSALHYGTLKGNDSILDVGTVGVVFRATGTIDGDTCLIQTDGKFNAAVGIFTPDNCTIQFTNGTVVWSVGANSLSYYDVIVDVGVDVTVEAKVKVLGTQTGSQTTDQDRNDIVTVNNDLEVSGTLHTAPSYALLLATTPPS